MNMIEKMNELRRALDNEMKAKDEILNEARTRIAQYENRLVEMKQESDQYKLNAEESTAQLRLLRETANATEQQAEIQRQTEEKAAETERKYQKLKSAYDTFRAEHLEVPIKAKTLISLFPDAL
jgi:chromosome segregation ATPase